jgi:hypothetical protein
MGMDDGGSVNLPVPDERLDVEAQRRAYFADILVVQLFQDRSFSSVVQPTTTSVIRRGIPVPRAWDRHSSSLIVKTGTYRNNTLISLDFALFLRRMVSRPVDVSAWSTSRVEEKDGTYPSLHRSIVERLESDIQIIQRTRRESWRFRNVFCVISPELYELYRQQAIL